jgi:hypothetical protein
MKTYLLTGTYTQHFSVIVHSDGDEDEITEEGYAAFKRGDYLPGTIDDVDIDEIEQLEGNTDPED